MAFIHNRDAAHQNVQHKRAMGKVRVRVGAKDRARYRPLTITERGSRRVKKRGREEEERKNAAPASSTAASKPNLLYSCLLAGQGKWIQEE